MPGELDAVDWGPWLFGAEPPRHMGTLVSAWTALQSVDRDDANFDAHPQFWAHAAAERLTGNYPDLAFAFIKATIASGIDGRARFSLAAGPLEDLLARHGAEVISRIEQEARQDPLFRETLGGVWRNAIAPEVWERVQMAQGHQAAAR